MEGSSQSTTLRHSPNDPKSILEFTWKDWRNRRKTRGSMTGFCTKIRTKHLWNRSLETTLQYLQEGCNFRSLSLFSQVLRTPLSTCCVSGSCPSSLGDDGGQYTERGSCHLECGAADPGTTPAPGGAVTRDPSATVGSGAAHSRGCPVLRQGQASLDHQE